jgi:hypothetical protein
VVNNDGDRVQDRNSRLSDRGEQGMSMRKKKLNEEDRAAVDLLLDRHTDGFFARGLSDSGVFVKSVEVQPQRVRSVKQILSVLKELPAAEPPTDLAGKTLRRVYGSGSVDNSTILRSSAGNRASDRQTLS